MIRWQRRFRMQHGRQQEALKWAREVVKHVNANFGPTVLQLFVPQLSGEEMDTLVWMADFDSLAAMEQVVDRVMSDPGFQEINARGTELLRPPFTTGTFRSID